MYSGSCKGSLPCGTYNGTSQSLSATLASSISNDTLAAVADLSDMSTGHFIAIVGSGASSYTYLWYSPTGQTPNNACIATKLTTGT